MSEQVVEQVPEQTINVPLLCKVVNKILEHPETWYQGQWHSACGTKHCIAGHTQIEIGKLVNSGTASRDAKEAL